MKEKILDNLQTYTACTVILLLSKSEISWILENNGIRSNQDRKNNKKMKQSYTWFVPFQKYLPYLQYIAKQSRDYLN